MKTLLSLESDSLVALIHNAPETFQWTNQTIDPNQSQPTKAAEPTGMFIVFVWTR